VASSTWLLVYLLCSHIVACRPIYTPSRDFNLTHAQSGLNFTEYQMTPKTEPTFTDTSVEDVQRGRKRQRREDVGMAKATKSPSGESATLRGRRRHRSTSAMTRSGVSSRNSSRSFRDTSRSRSPPSRKCFLWIFQVERRRDQSPSRSPNTWRAPRRRRQRTRSRGRVHRVESISKLALDVKPAVQSEVIVADKVECEAQG